MINIGFWSYYEENCFNNNLFLNKDASIRENTFVKYNLLYKNLNEIGITINSLDLIVDNNKLDLLIFSDIPRSDSKYYINVKNLKIPKILIIEECKLIRPQNWNLQLHKEFDYIFTYEDDYVDNLKYFKFNTNFIETRDINYNLDHKIKDFTMINSNKKAISKGELYSERLKVINWFEKNHPYNFDLWGWDWDRFTFPSDIKYIDRLNSKKLNFLFKGYNFHKSWKGTVKIKKDTIKNYKFCFCIENFSNINGYITEKIFDSFFASTIPIYYGAKNVNTHIPPNCFFDYNQFNNFNEMYIELTNLNENQYLDYLKNIDIFLNSSKSIQFSEQYFVNELKKIILKIFKWQ